MHSIEQATSHINWLADALLQWRHKEFEGVVNSHDICRRLSQELFSVLLRFQAMQNIFVESTLEYDYLR